METAPLRHLNDRIVARLALGGLLGEQAPFLPSAAVLPSTCNEHDLQRTDPSRGVARIFQGWCRPFRGPENNPSQNKKSANLAHYFWKGPISVVKKLKLKFTLQKKTGLEGSMPGAKGPNQS